MKAKDIFDALADDFKPVAKDRLAIKKIRSGFDEPVPVGLAWLRSSDHDNPGWDLIVYLNVSNEPYLEHSCHAREAWHERLFIFGRGFYAENRDVLELLSNHGFNRPEECFKLNLEAR